MQSQDHPQVVIIGSGPAGLMAATQLLETGAAITIIDHKSAAGRKFLVAGDGGFNITHSESLETFLEKYNRSFVRNAVRQFPPEATRSWLHGIGIATFIGSSGKVFPIEGIKPIAVLNAWLKQLQSPAVSWRFKTRLVDFDAHEVQLQSGSETATLPYDYLVFALGGASWKKTGSDGSWLELFSTKGIPVKPFYASNSGVELAHTNWLKQHEGAILKNIRLTAGTTTVPGDVVVTTYGLEGKPVYASNGFLRENVFKGLKIDFKPQFSIEKVGEVFAAVANVREAFRKLKVPTAVYDWLKESCSKTQFTDPVFMSAQLKAFEPAISGFRPIDEVISSVGGIDIDAVNEQGELRTFPKVFCCGEMLDWDAPTGGYLLQGCFATGFVAGQAIKRNLNCEGLNNSSF